MQDRLIPDSHWATMGRSLADALRSYAKERRDDDKKEVARLQTELCSARRAETAAVIIAEPDGE